jgi:phosphoglycolate phosphatase
MSGLVAIRAVLFDKDGTLVDFNRTWAPAVEAVLRGLACGNDAVFQKLSAESGLEDGSRFDPRSPIIYEPTSVFAARWARALGRPAGGAFVRDIDRLLCEASTAHLTPIGDPKAVLRELISCGYLLGLITNDAEATARAHARKLGVDRMLAFVAGYDSGFGAKPAPGAVDAFSAAVGVAPNEAVVVGDTALDLATARAAGARAVLVLTGPKSADYLQEADADAVIASIAQLPAWLEAQGSMSGSGGTM